MSVDAKNLTYDQAMGLAKRIVASQATYCGQRIAIAGSLRRMKSFVHDIDIVLIPAHPLYFPKAIASSLKSNFNGEVVRAGPKILTMIVEGVQVDLYSATPEDWGINLLRWTGSKEHNIKLCRRALGMGLKLAVSEGVKKNGIILASRTEEDVFGALGMPWIPPEQREA